MSPMNAARFIRIVSALYLMSGVILAAAALPALAGPVAGFFDVVDWPVDGRAPTLTTDARLFAAIGGGVCAGFSALFIFVIAPLIERGDPLGKNGGLIGILSWFAIDSTGSILAGVPGNAVANVGFLLLVLVPLLIVRRP